MRLVIIMSAAIILLAATISASTSASVLPQIRRAIDHQEETSTPTLTKHFLEVHPGVLVAVKGERERRQVRIARWIRSLEGDRRVVYEHEGFPAFRHRESAAGVRTEHWTYPAKDRTYVFREGVLVETLLF